MDEGTTRVRANACIAAAAIVLAMFAGVGLAGPAAAADDCTLLGADDLERVLDIPFEAQPPVGPSCLFLSAKGARSSIVTAFAEERSPTAIADGKKQLRKQPGARVLRGVGDLAVLTTEPTTDPTGDDTLGLVIFRGNQFASVGITVAGKTPTTKQMRRLGKIVAAQL
jgi:hypothetical protein